MIKKLHNGTLKTVTNIRVPKKWKRFEYLESTGTQWIDTGYVPNNNTTLDVDYQLTQIPNSTYLQRIIGSRNGTKDRAFVVAFTDGGTNASYLDVCATYTNSSATTYFKTSNYGNTSRYHLIIDNNCFIFNGTIASTYSNKAIFTCPGNAYLFAYNYKNNQAYGNTWAKIYSCKIYESEVLIRDFVPCEYNGQYGMWDLVENKFYGNKGTGTFKVGPEVPNYDEVEYIKRPNHLLPNGIELYDYLEGDGFSWIDTTFNNNTLTQWEYFLDFQCIGSQPPQSGLYGPLDGTRSGTLWFNNGFKISIGETHSGISAFSYTYDTNRHKFSINIDSSTGKYIHSWDRVNKAETAFSNTNLKSSNSVMLFRSMMSSYPAVKCKIYQFTIKEGTTLVRNFLPCTYFGEPGMWDTVTNKFYGNSGTGQFKLGNKIELKEYEYLQSSGNQYVNSGILLNEDFKIQSKFMPLEMGNSAMIWGSYVSGNRYDLQFTSGFWAQRSNTAIYQGTVDKTNVNDLVGNIYEVQDTLTDIIINNKSYSNKTIPKFKQNNYNLYIFAGRSDNYRAKAKLFYFKYYDNNTLVRDYYPCSYNGEYGLWDRVELKFYPNAGIGSFTVGPRVDGNVNIYEKKNALIGDGIAYINPNLSLTLQNSTEVYCKINISQGDWNGANWASQANWSKITKNKDVDFKLISKSDGTNFTVRGYENDVQITDMDRNWKCSQNLNTYAFLIFNMAAGSTAIPGYPTTKGKIYYYRIYVDGKLVRDFIPAMLGGKPGLYDKVEHKMYYNANSTGQFTVE